jgi:hypothetical protein
MKIRAKIELRGANAALAGAPLMQDNTARMKTVVTAERVMTCFETDKLGSLIASVDDYLMNARIACDILDLVEGEHEEPV